VLGGHEPARSGGGSRLLQPPVRLGVRERAAPDSPGKYFVARLRGGEVAAVGSIPEAMPQTATWNTYVWVDSADEAATKVSEAGGSVVMEPFDVMDSGRMAVFTDPEGATLCIWQAKAHLGARIVNEPVSVTFNGLNTRDVDGAKSFYGSVFGWTTLTLDGAEMWTLPGYGDHLEREYHPDLRKTIAEVGGPEASRTSSQASTRFPTTSPTRRRTGASPSRSTTPTPRRRGPRNSAERCSRRRSTLRGPG
jgi:predicted enzyme related to lactoylglutathione lyase